MIFYQFGLFVSIAKHFNIIQISRDFRVNRASKVVAFFLALFGGWLLLRNPFIDNRSFLLTDGIAHAQTGLVGWWKFDEGSGSSTEIQGLYNGGSGSFTVTIVSSNPTSGASITVSPNDNNNQGNGTTQFTRVYNSTTAVTLAAPSTNGGNNFNSWSGCDSSSGTTCNVTMSANKTVTATYATPPPPTRTLTVASSNPATGASIAITPADNNSQSNGTTQVTRVYSNGTPVTLVAAVTAGGNRFNGWSGCDSSSGHYCNVTMSADTTVTAAYTALPPPQSWVVEPNQYGRLVVRIIDQAALDALLQSKWAAMKSALRAGDTATAASYFTKEKVAIYKSMFDHFKVPYSQIDSYLGNIVWLQQRSVYIEYTLQGGSLGGTVIFQLEQDNEWRIRFF